VSAFNHTALRAVWRLQGIAQLEPLVAATQPTRSRSRRGTSRPDAGGSKEAAFPSRPPTATVPEEASTNSDGDATPLPPLSPLLSPLTPPLPVPLTLKEQLVGARRVVAARVAYAASEFGAANKGDLSELRAIDKELLLLARAPKDPVHEVSCFFGVYS
jgi:hypothetical protein